MLDLSLAVETENFRAITALRDQLDTVTRRQLVGLLASALQAAYGAGMINWRERKELTALFQRAFFEPITRNGLDLENLRQGNFFTRPRRQEPGERWRQQLWHRAAADAVFLTHGTGQGY